ncbi:MAG: ABC transporter substrate-binding protein [Planctomycetes bacterium]|nr:ABC transporter substrate-binding protein [Planctomycetota bacterium]
MRGTDPTPWNKLAPIDADSSAAQVAAVLRRTPAPASQKSPPGACIGVLGPFKRTIMLPSADSAPAQASHRADLTAAQIAVSAKGDPGENEGDSIRVEYIPGGFASYAWRLPEDDIVLLAAHGDAAIVGAFRPEERISYVAARGLQVPVMNASHGPVTTAEALSPWIFRCRINDPRAHNALLDQVIDDLGRTRIAIVRTPGAAAELHLDWWSKHARSRGHAAILDAAFDPAGDDPKPLVDQLRRADPTAILTWADAKQSAAILRLLRDAGLPALLVVSDEAVRDEFVQLCGPSPGDVIAPYPCPHRQDPASSQKLTEHYGRQPPPLSAVLTFDAVQHAMDAIRAAGPDRRAIREELVRTSRFAAARLEGGRWIRWPKDADANRSDAASTSQPAGDPPPSKP